MSRSRKFPRGGGFQLFDKIFKLMREEGIHLVLVGLGTSIPKIMQYTFNSGSSTACQQNAILLAG